MNYSISRICLSLFLLVLALSAGAVTYGCSPTGGGCVLLEEWPLEYDLPPLVTEVTDTSIRLVWASMPSAINPGMGGGVSGYRVYYSTSPMMRSSVKPGAYLTSFANSYTITGLRPGTTYYIGVTAVDIDGMESMFVSPQAIATTGTAGTIDRRTFRKGVIDARALFGYAVGLSWYNIDPSAIDAIEVIYSTTPGRMSIGELSRRADQWNGGAVSCVIPFPSIPWGEGLTQMPTILGRDNECAMRVVAPGGAHYSSLVMMWDKPTTIKDKSMAIRFRYADITYGEWTPVSVLGTDAPRALTISRQNESIFVPYPSNAIESYSVYISDDTRQYSTDEFLSLINTYYYEQEQNRKPKLSFCSLTFTRGQRNVTNAASSQCDAILDWSRTDGVLMKFPNANIAGRTIAMNYTQRSGENQLSSLLSNAITMPAAQRAAPPVVPSPIEEVAPHRGSSIPYEQRTDALNRFTDGHQVGEIYRAGLEYVFHHGMVEGYPDGAFRPHGYVNRAEFTKIIMNAVHRDRLYTYVTQRNFDQQSCFGDVPRGEWYQDYVCYARSIGVIGGYPDNTFRPANYINKAEAVKILLEAYDVAPTAQELQTNTGQWWEPYSMAAVRQGVLRYVHFGADQLVTRQEMVELIYRLEQL